MIFAPVVNGSLVTAVNVNTGARIQFDTQAMVLSASNAGEEICIQTKNGETLLWNPSNGNLRRIRV